MILPWTSAGITTLAPACLASSIRTTLTSASQNSTVIDGTSFPVVAKAAEGSLSIFVTFFETGLRASSRGVLESRRSLFVDCSWGLGLTTTRGCCAEGARHPVISKYTETAVTLERMAGLRLRLKGASDGSIGIIV